jgi:hypothetical protein
MQQQAAAMQMMQHPAFAFGGGGACPQQFSPYADPSLALAAMYHPQLMQQYFNQAAFNPGFAQPPIVNPALYADPRMAYAAYNPDHGPAPTAEAVGTAARSAGVVGIVAEYGRTEAGMRYAARGAAQTAAASGGALSGLARGVGRVAMPIAVVADAIDIGSSVSADAARGDGRMIETTRAVGRVGGGWGGALAGAAVGQAVIPIPIVGAAVGAIAGAVGGSWIGERLGSLFG